jgi:hypothetical protein
LGPPSSTSATAQRGLLAVAPALTCPSRHDSPDPGHHIVRQATIGAEDVTVAQTAVASRPGIWSTRTVARVFGATV